MAGKTTIGNLSAVVSADSERMVGGLNTASRAVGRFKQQAAGQIRGLGGQVDSASKSFGRFNAGFGLAIKGVAGFAAAYVTLGAAAKITSVAISNVSSAAERIDSTGKVAARVGIATEQLIAWRHAAELGGATTQMLDKSLIKMVVNVDKARRGTGEAVAALDMLGLNTAEFFAMKPDRQFLAVADALHRIDNQADRVTATYGLFGEEGVKLVNVLQQGSGALNAIQNRTRRLGLGFSSQQASSVEAMNDSIRQLQRTGEAGWESVTVAIAPTVTKAANLLTAALVHVKDISGVVSSLAPGFWHSIVPASVREFINGMAFIAEQFVAQSGLGKIELPRLEGLDDLDDKQTGILKTIESNVRKIEGQFDVLSGTVDQLVRDARYISRYAGVVRV